MFEHHLRHLEARGVREATPPAAAELALRARCRSRRDGRGRGGLRATWERLPLARLRACEAT
jgi:hypothetical protein